MSSVPAVTPRAPERALQEILHAFLSARFNGVPRPSPLGDITLECCDLLFNQADLPNPERLPQIHAVFTSWRQESCHWLAGDLGTWGRVLVTVASGVSYGATNAGTVEESVHGKLARVLPGSDIRWRRDGSNLLEETLIAGVWTVQRAMVNTSAIKWIRDGFFYREQARVGGWQTIRSITMAHPVWDGATARFTADVEASFFVRVGYLGGDRNKSDFRCRTNAAALVEILNDPQERAELGTRGVRSLHHLSGPRTLPSAGYATRMSVFSLRLEARLPREGY